MMTGQIKMTLLIFLILYMHMYRHRNSAVWRSSPHCSLH